MVGKHMYLRIPPAHVGLFRCLLEAYENVAYFTVVDRYAAWLRVVYTGDMEDVFHRVLAEIGQTIAFTGRIDDC